MSCKSVPKSWPADNTTGKVDSIKAAKLACKIKLLTVGGSESRGVDCLVIIIIDVVTINVVFLLHYTLQKNVDVVL